MKISVSHKAASLDAIGPDLAEGFDPRALLLQGAQFFHERLLLELVATDLDAQQKQEIANSIELRVLQDGEVLVEIGSECPSPLNLCHKFSKTLQTVGDFLWLENGIKKKIFYVFCVRLKFI